MTVRRLVPLLGLFLVVACQTPSSPNASSAPTNAAPASKAQQQAAAMALMQWYNHAISDSRW
jgi:hypothetical protein